MPRQASELVKPFGYKNLFIKAGAGAGKTTFLIKTFFDFTENYHKHHDKYPRIVMTTFTRKATQELRERLLVKALESQNADLFEMVNKKSHVHISTIHGLLSVFLKKNAESLGLPLPIKIIDSQQLNKKIFRELKKILRENPDYAQLLQDRKMPDLIKLLIKAVDFKREHGELKCLSLSAVTGERDNKIKSVLDIINSVLSVPNLGEKWQEYLRFLSEIAKLLNSLPFDQAAYKKLSHLLEIKPKKPAFLKKNPPFSEELNESLTALFKDQFAINYADTNESLESFVAEQNLFCDLVNRVEKELSQHLYKSGEMSIADLELLSWQIINQNPQATKEFAESYDYYMIDEFQDTSPLQVKILDAFLKWRPHFIVGDPQQSIYLFRGARSEVFTEKEKQADLGHFDKVYLNKNFRSEPQLMSFMNDFFVDFSAAFSPMELKESSQDQEPVQAYYVSAEDESFAVAESILRLREQGVPLSDICILSTKNSKLTRLSQKLEQKNIPYQLQVAAGFEDRREILDLMTLLRFLVNPHDNLNLLSLLRSPWLKFSDETLLDLRQKSKNESLWNDLKLAIQLPQAEIKNYNLLKKIRSTYIQSGLFESVMIFLSESDFLLCSMQLDSSGKRESNVWKFVDSLSEAIRQKAFNLNDFISQNFQQFQSDLGSQQSEALALRSPDRVTLMTIHSSKGLQFPHIIIVGFADNPQMTLSYPLALDPETHTMSLAVMNEESMRLQQSDWGERHRQLFNKREIEENERLLYVAMTRAEKSLTLITENRQRIWETSWFKKTKWPETGVHKGDNYVVQSYQVNSDVVELPLTHKQNTEVRSEFLKTDKALLTPKTPTAVTGLISSQGGVNQNQNHFLVSSLQKAQKGTELHRVFESMKYLNMNELESKVEKSDWPAIQYLAKLNDIPLQEILQHGHVEWGFGLKTEEYGLIQGQIDAWGIKDHQLYILDYKTGSSQYLEKALQQLSFYVRCLKKMNLLDSILEVNLVAIYPSEQKTFIQRGDLSSFNELI